VVENELNLAEPFKFSQVAQLVIANYLTSRQQLPYVHGESVNLIFSKSQLEKAIYCISELIWIRIISRSRRRRRIPSLGIFSKKSRVADNLATRDAKYQ